MLFWAAKSSIETSMDLSCGPEQANRVNDSTAKIPSIKSLVFIYPLFLNKPAGAGL
jgi:hypothetical protein